jgi:hypothetical protein
MESITSDIVRLCQYPTVSNRHVKGLLRARFVQGRSLEAASRTDARQSGSNALGPSMKAGMSQVCFSVFFLFFL